MNREAPGRGSSNGVALAEPPAPAKRTASEKVPAPPRRPGPPRRIILAAFALAAAGGIAWTVGPPGLRDYLPGHDKRKEEALILYGNVDVRQVNLSFKVGGRIVSLAVDEGDSARAGEVVAELDRRYFEDELRLSRARRDVQSAKLARLEHGSRPEEIAEARALVAERVASAYNATIELRRSKQLIARNAAPRQELDLNQAAMGVADAQLASAREALRLAEIGPRVEDIDAARAELAAAEADVTQAERRLEDSRLIAPGAGVILTRARETGAIVQPGETVFTLTLANPLWVRTYVSESDLSRVRPGAVVEILTDGSPGHPYRAHVGYISPTAEFTPKTVESEELRTRLVYRVRIVVDDIDGSLRQGMPVTVRLPLVTGGGSR